MKSFQPGSAFPKVKMEEMVMPINVHFIWFVYMSWVIKAKLNLLRSVQSGTTNLSLGSGLEGS